MVKCKHFDNKILNNSLIVEQIKDNHLSKVNDLWQTQYRTENLNRSVISDSWMSDISSFNFYLQKHIKAKKGVIVKLQDDMIGYMVYNNFEFHGEKTAFSPIVGHAALPALKDVVYKKIYQYLSAKWAEEGCLNHIITFFASDKLLKNLFFHLGFGLYVIDAFGLVNTTIHKNNSDVKIRKANRRDLYDYMRMDKESYNYFKQAPIFLIQKPQKKEYYENLMDKETTGIFLAYIDDEMVGFMKVDINEEEDITTLSDKNTGLLNSAYIKPEYRGREIGNFLLKRCFEWCQEKKLKLIHVDFESANLFGSNFWLKHFVPVLYSVKRRLNQDILTYRKSNGDL